MSEELHETWVAQATKGDSEAIDALLEHHLPALVAYVRLHASDLIRAKESCVDIVQSVCREVLEETDSFEFRGIPAFRRWLFTKVRNKFADRQRYYLAARRHPAREVRPSRFESRTRIEGLYATLCTPSEFAIGREKVERFEQAFAQLPEDYRKVITLSRIMGLSHAEIAEEMGRKEGAVRVLLHRALVKLGFLMNDAEVEGAGGD